MWRACRAVRASFVIEIERRSLLTRRFLDVESRSAAFPLTEFVTRGLRVFSNTHILRDLGIGHPSAKREPVIELGSNS
jgi:hypothetical protein